MVLSKLKTLLGNIPEDPSNSFRHRMRIHQGWWRTVVLGEDPGEHPKDPKKTICNTIHDGDPKRNFLSEGAYNAFLLTKQERSSLSRGIVEEKRLLNNLLSSQPLAFNFFGEFKVDPAFATTVLRIWLPEIDTVEWVKFEYAPENNYSNDLSAFDVALKYRTKNGAQGLFGLECKYTDDFSTSGKPRKEYENIYNSNPNMFIQPYQSYLQPRYVQLFRNQLIAQSLINNDGYDEVYTGLFCHHDDQAALGVGREFQNMIGDGSNRFRIITYRDFIVEIQRMNLTREQREWTMYLWARYCALGLSDRLYNEAELS